MPSTDDLRKEQGKFPHLEERVVSWMKDLSQKGVTISGGSIKRYAKQVYGELFPEDATVEFKASNGWLSRFLSRHNPCCRSVTSQGQKYPAMPKISPRTFFNMYTRRF